MVKAAHSLTPVQRRLAASILGHVRTENLPKGARLREQDMAARFGTSRAPVRAVLAYLVSIGVAARDDGRGWALARAASDLGQISRALVSAGEDPLYQAIADWRLDGGAAGAATEAELIRRFAASRTAVRRVLQRIQQEGWVERKTGHGWTFLSLIDSAGAYEESYALRIAVEPAAILAPEYRPDPADLLRQQRIQQAIVDGGFRTMTPAELFDANARFHEALAAWSGNRFMLQTIRRLNGLRRLVEYRHAAADRAARRVHAQEHLRILDRIAAADFLDAASLMRRHLESARREKSTAAFRPAAGPGP